MTLLFGSVIFFLTFTLSNKGADTSQGSSRVDSDLPYIFFIHPKKILQRYK